jgi:CBS domain-containing protein
MSSRVVTIGVGESLRDAAARMISNRIHHLPVTDDAGDVVGMLSTMDLTAYSSYTDGRDAE